MKQKQKVFFSARPAPSDTSAKIKIVSSDSGLINVGWTVDLEKGTSTVPRDGYYALAFHSLSSKHTVIDDSYTTASIVCNEEQVVSSTMAGEQPFALAAVQKLRKHDQLSVVITGKIGSTWTRARIRAGNSTRNSSRSPFSPRSRSTNRQQSKSQSVYAV